MQQGHAVDPAPVVASLGLGVLLLAAIAAAYVVVAWRLGRQHGRRGLIVSWLAAAATVTTLAVVSAVHNLAVVRPVAGRDVLMFMALYLLVFAAGLGAVAWFVSRRLGRSSVAAPTIGMVAVGVLSFFGALLVLALPVLIWDVTRLF